MAAGLKRTPLFPLYAEYGGKTIDFGGWDLPVQFEGILKEHEAVRERVGLFDVSHMGEFLITGKDAYALLQKLTTNDIGKLEPGAAQYTLMCYPDGGTVDDLLVYQLSEQRYMAVVNASNITKDLDWLHKHAEGDVTVTDISEETSLLALQGPAAAQVLARVNRELPLASLRPFRFIEDAELDGVSVLLSRTGYTGEDGFELYVPSAAAELLWRTLMAAGEAFGLVPVGLGARDTLRFEARLPLYGQELTASISPLEAGLSMFVKLEKGEFIGRDALQAQKVEGVPRKLVGIEMLERGIPRSHYDVYSTDGQRIGEITSGTQSPTRKLNLGLAIVDQAFAVLGTELYVDVRGKRLKAQVVRTPFYKRS